MGKVSEQIPLGRKTTDADGFWSAEAFKVSARGTGHGMSVLLATPPETLARGRVAAGRSPRRKFEASINDAASDRNNGEFRRCDSPRFFVRATRGSHGLTGGPMLSAASPVPRDAILAIHVNSVSSARIP